MPFIIQINVRHSNTQGGVTNRFLHKFNNFTFTNTFNSLASQFSFDYYFDPKDKASAELICVSHLHECKLYFTSNTTDGYIPKQTEKVFTGWLILAKFKNTGKAEFVRMSGYSKPGVLLDCDIPADQYPLQTDGLTFRSIILKLIKPFHLWNKNDINKNTTGLVVNKKANADFIVQSNIESNIDPITSPVANPFAIAENIEKNLDQGLDTDEKKKSASSSQNIASYLTELAKAKNIVLSHNEFGNVYITVPNTKSKPIFDFDFTNPLSDVRKIPGIETELTFNGQALHTHIVVKQDADDEEESNGIESKVLKNPLIPIGIQFLYRPKVVTLSSGDQFNVDKAAVYELGREIRDAITLDISLGRITDLNGKLIKPNQTLLVADPNIFLYKQDKKEASRWFIQEVQHEVDEKGERCTLKCVLPFAYDYNLAMLKNVFVDPHENLPKI